MIGEEKKNKSILVLFLPIMIIISQWISVGSINLSFIIYGILTIVSFLHISKIKDNYGLILFIFIILFWPTISFAFGKAPDFNTNLYLSIITGLICLIYIYIIDERKFICFLKGCGIACIIFSIWGLFEIYTGNYLLFAKIDNNLLTHRLNIYGLHYPGVAFANTNDLAQFLVLLFPCQYLLLKKHKFLNVIFLVTTFLVVLNSESKLAMISYILILLLGYFININVNSNNKKIKYVTIALIILGLCFLINSYTGVFSDMFEQNFNINVEADYYTGRSDIYTNLLNVSMELPFGGFGTAYAIQSFPPHNLILYILCDFGWLWIVTFLIWIFCIGKSIYKKISRCNERFFYSLMFCEVLFFIVLSSISSCNEQRKVIWIFLAICIRMAKSSVYTKKNELDKIKVEEEKNENINSYY